MFLKTVIRQGEKIMQLEEEEKNTDEKVAELTYYQINTEKLHNSIIRDLLNLQDISRLGIAECEKDKHRNVIINRIIKELVQTDNQETNSK